MTLQDWLLMVPYPGIEVLRLPTFFFQNRPRTTKALSPIFCGQGAHCSIAGICFSAESEPEISLCLTEALRCIELGGMKPEGFFFVSSSLLSWNEGERISCLAVQSMDCYKSDQARIGIGAWHIPSFFMSLTLFLYLCSW